MNVSYFGFRESPPPKHVHDFTQIVEEIPATCTVNGKVIKRCACGETEESILPATGHKFGEWIKIDEITEERTCSICGYKETRTILIDG
jgi:predicted nucleic-acid-binding Zn-ribbon protein